MLQPTRTCGRLTDRSPSFHSLWLPTLTFRRRSGCIDKLTLEHTETANTLPRLPRVGRVSPHYAGKWSPQCHNGIHPEHTDTVTRHHHPHIITHAAQHITPSHPNHRTRITKRVANGPTLCPCEEPPLDDSPSVVAGISVERRTLYQRESSQFAPRITHHLTHRDRHHATASLQFAHVTSHAASESGAVSGASTNSFRSTPNRPTHRHLAPPQSRPHHLALAQHHLSLATSRHSCHAPLRGCVALGRPLQRLSVYLTHCEDFPFPDGFSFDSD